MDKNTCGIFLGNKLNIGASKMGRYGHAPTLSLISFIFMEFLANLSRKTGWRPLLWGWHTHLWEILDLPLLKNFFRLQWPTYTEKCWLRPSLLQDCKISCDLLGKFWQKIVLSPTLKGLVSLSSLRLVCQRPPLIHFYWAVQQSSKWHG